jgi:hypothetical protein
MEAFSRITADPASAAGESAMVLTGSRERLAAIAWQRFQRRSRRDFARNLQPAQKRNSVYG